MAYVKNATKPAPCIFCVKPQERCDAANLLLHRGRHGLVMMNLFPYNSGHLLIAPYDHVDALDQLSEEAALDLFHLTTLSLKVLRAELKPEGFNLGINLGRVAGAGIDDHVHLHIVPRWNGDTNFMPLFAETRVIPEHLRATYRRLRTRFSQLATPGTRPSKTRGHR
jgi:ATP adenylyltransferase